MKVFNKQVWRGLAATFTLSLGVFSLLNTLAYEYSGFLNDRLGIVPPKAESDEDSVKYKSKYGELNADNCKKLIEDENEFNIQSMEEGAVLLRNENNALPLKSEERSITFFGNSVANPVYATNGGGSSFKESRGGSLKDAFESAGFKINETMFNAYANSGVKRVSSQNGSESSIGEVPISFYTDTLKASFSNDYNDAAIVLLTRYGGEGVDLALSDKDGLPLLSLHQEEKDLLLMIKNSNKFKKIIVLVNSPFAMDIEWIEDSEYGVDACLAFGAAGDVGFKGIANLLVGNADFSGHLVDTYASNSLSAPAMRNFGDFSYSNGLNQYADSYVVYAEDIYVGYKYYETRYHDQVLGINNATGSKGVYNSKDNSWNYASEMAYTFGYGLSYSDFSQELTSVTWDKENHELKATVKVTNNGPKDGSNYSGKSKTVIQVYASLPYEKGMAQKSAIQLIGFEKSDLLAEGESKTYTVTCDDYLFATYDEEATNGADTTKKGCYVFDPGDYYFAIGNDAHDALNNVLAKKGVTTNLTDEKGNVVTGDESKVYKENLATLDNVTYAKANGEVVSNQFEFADYNTYKENSITYLTRSDWNTYPDSYTNLEVTDSLKTLLSDNTYVKPSDAKKYEDVTLNVASNLEFVDMVDVDYDDAKWETFINQLTLNDLATIMGEAMGNEKISTVNKPANSNTDGPKGLGSSYTYGDKSGITLYVDQVVQASTFNKDLIKERGEFFAEDALYANYSMIFGPGADWHRTPYSGRNSEYYSEDSNMSFMCGAIQVKAMQEGGVIPSIKHFAANDQETNRHGVSTFGSEQGLREGSFRCFEGALRDDKGGGLGTMTCFNRIGPVAGAACYELLTQLLRNEWGFKGVNLTDSSKDASDYVLSTECVMAGTDMFNNDTARKTELVKLARSNGDLVEQMKKANKHYYYAYVHSNLVNGLKKGVEVADFVPWWQTALNAVIITLSILTGASLIMFILSNYVFKDKREVK